jgi:hypothetical protein
MHTLRLVWPALVCVDMASEHEIERSSMGHIDDVIAISSIYLWNYIAGRDDQGGIVDEVHVITRTF